MHFFHYVRQTCFAYNFCWCIIKKNFNGFEISEKFCVFFIYFYFSTKFFLSSLCFLKILKPNAQKTAQKIRKCI
jgi:hypothetical protein